MSAPQVSLVIVSKGRPEHLAALLQSLRHQTCENFEVVLVADHRPDNFPDVRFIPFDTPNISAARNLGVANSAGQLIAFCDDDAIPDPPWLERLIAPFTDPGVGASSGFTRGRNGISRQWGAMRFDRSGRDLPFEIDEGAFQTYPPNPKRPIKLLGTCMAFRKSALLEIGGFDENFRFFLDETDAKLRLDTAGWKSAIVPNAQVHHRFAPSPRRQANRVPTDLFEIGASKAYFCEKHTDDSTQALQDFTQEQNDRLDRLKVKAAEKSALLHSLAAGLEDGLKRQTSPEKMQHAPPEFRPFKSNATPHVVLCAGPFDDAWLKHALTEHLSAGNSVSVIKMQPSIRYFQVRFQGGYWQHEGGAYGKSVRSQPTIQLGTFTRRFEREVARISKLHQISKVLRAPNRAPVRFSTENPHESGVK